MAELPVTVKARQVVKRIAAERLRDEITAYFAVRRAFIGRPEARICTRREPRLDRIVVHVEESIRGEVFAGSVALPPGPVNDPYAVRVQASRLRRDWPA